MLGARLHRVRTILRISYSNLIVSLVGYDPCRVLTGPDFQSVFNLQLWASNAKLINYYMIYGYVLVHSYSTYAVLNMRF
jgi:hypothetical protein